MIKARATRGIILGVAAASLFASPIALGVGKATATCVGTTSSKCTAKVSLAEGASNKVITIVLSGTNQKLASVSVPKAHKGSYTFSMGTHSMGGSVYTARLNAVQSISTGVYATLVFRVT